MNKAYVLEDSQTCSGYFFDCWMGNLCQIVIFVGLEFKFEGSCSKKCTNTKTLLTVNTDYFPNAN